MEEASEWEERQVNTKLLRKEHALERKCLLEEETVGQELSWLQIKGDELSWKEEEDLQTDSLVSSLFYWRRK